jgi:MFS family permease
MSDLPRRAQAGRGGAALYIGAMNGTIAVARQLPWIGLAGWFLASFAFFYAWVLRVSPSVMIEPLMAEFEMGGALLGTLSGLYFYTYAFLQSPVGLAIDRWGVRRSVTAATLVAALGTVIFGWAPTIEFAFLGRLLIGAGVAFAFVGAMVLAAAWFPPRRFAALSGLTMSAGMLGGVVGQAPLALLVGAIGWRNANYALAAIALALVALSWLVIRDRPPGAPARATKAGGAGVWRELWIVVRRRQTLLLAAFTGLMSSSLLVFGALWGVPFTMVRYGLDKAEAASITSAALIGFASGAASWGWLSDRVGRRKAPMMAGVALALAASLGAYYAPGLPVSLYTVLLFLIGFGAACMIVAYAATREHNAAGAMGGALGFVNMVSVLGGAFFQPLVGWLLDLQWDGRLVEGARVYSLEAYRVALAVLPATLALAFVTAAGVRETYCKPAAVA